MFASIRLWAVYVAALALPGVIVAAESERGRPLIQRFSAQEYRAHYQIWSATQAPEGTMWFGTQGAVVEYDGNTWRKCLIETSFARQTAIGPDGKLYVGGEDSLGWVERMPDGAIEYRSLLDQIPAEAKPIGLSRRVIATADAVYIASDRHVFRWRGGQMKTWSFAGNERATMEAIGGEIILIRGTQGILRLEGSDEFRLLSDPPELKQPQFKFLLPPPPGSGALALLTLGSAGAFLLQPDGSLRPWTNAASDAIKPLQPFSGIQLSDGRYAIGTMNGGLFLIAPDGSSHLRYTMADGLTHDTIIGLGEDREGGLWATTQNGINRIDLVTPATLFDKNTGLGEGIIFEFLRHDGVLYAAANHALLRLHPASGASPAHWAPDPRIPPETPVQRIASHSRGLVVASTDLKLLSASGSETIKENPSRRITVMHRSKTDPDRIFLGYDAVVGSIVWRGGRWIDEGLMEGLSGEPYTMLEEADGTLWVATGTRGVFRVRRPDPTTAWNRAEVQHFYENKGLPKGHGWIFVRQGPFGPDFSMTGGNYFFDNARGEFVRQATYLLEGRRVEGIMEPLEPIPGGEWWASTRRQRLEADIGLISGRLDPADGLMKFRPAIASIRSLMGISGAQVIYGEEADGIVWLKGMDSVIRYETRLTRPRPLVWRPLLREIRAEGRGQNISPTSPLQLDYSTEPIIFSYSGALFGLNAAPEFQTRLLGFRDTWSEFSRKTEEAFTNLSGGPFVFEVRARNADGRMSEIARQTFTVSPPWYQRPVTFGGYALILAGAVAGVIRWRTAASERERARLEKIVAERTAELKVAKDAADEANRAKSTFLANMSHELRTPLNGVIGYAQVLMKDRELSEKNRERLRIVQTSGEHLLRMINEVLDFSKIEAGKMELVTTPFHLPQLLRDIAAAVSPRFEQKGLEFVFDPAPDLPDLVLGDPQKLRQVIDNLLGNAAKFTQAGTVRFRAQLSGLETVEFSVADTGVGIAAQDIGRLFQPFQQAVDGRPPEPGTGLGLAISQRLVTLMGSRLGVDSQPGQGSRFFFSVELPVLAVDATAQRTETQAIVGYRGPRRRLLIVDDVATNRHVLRDLLTPLGFTIAEAAGGAEALAIVPQVQPELIFLDLRMPGIDGFELARRLRERPGGKELKIFAMSASVLSFNREKAFAAGCDDFLPKPFREEDLLSRLGLALQLEWVRDADAPAARPASRHPFPSLTTRLATDVVEELLAIARRGEIAQLRRRLDELKGDPLVDSLDVFVKTYRMERIREVLERHLSSPPAP